MAARSPRSLMVFRATSESMFWTISAMADLPNRRRRWVTGTLPGRKPLMRTSFLRALRRVLRRSSSSWRRDDDLEFALQAIGQGFGHLHGRLLVLDCLFAPKHRRVLAWRARAPGSSSVGRRKWCGRRDLNPHDFRHGNLNPARLPVPPRPPGPARRRSRQGAASISKPASGSKGKPLDRRAE